MGDKAEIGVKVKKKSSLCRKGVIGLYVCAGLSLICVIYMLYYSITYVSSYYASYGMSISEGIKDVIQYVASSTGNYLGFAILFFAAAVILKKVDALSSKPEVAQQQIELENTFKEQLTGAVPKEEALETEEEPQQDAELETPEGEMEAEALEEAAGEPETQEEGDSVELQEGEKKES